MDRAVHLHDDFLEVRRGGDEFQLLVGIAVHDRAPDTPDPGIEENVVRGVVEVYSADHAIGQPILDRRLQGVALRHRRSERAVLQ
jgi:hypothetical protein